MSVPAIIYTGDQAFADAYEPITTKSEWGMDTLTRLMRGSQPNLLPFAQGLAQGQVYDGFYLQTWQCDNNPVYPGMTLVYKGLFGGIPPPLASGSQVELSVSVSVDGQAGGTPGTTSLGNFVSATRQIKYVTRQTVTRYIAAARPGGPTYGLDVSNPNDFLYILSSVIIGTKADGSTVTYSGQNAPAALVAGLTPAAGVQSFMDCSPVVGSIYFECQDRATYIFQGT